MQETTALPVCKLYVVPRGRGGIATVHHRHPLLPPSPLSPQVRHLLKLSPEKWEEVSQHALAAVVPDFRNRVWWCPSIRSGLLFACKNGSVAMEHPIGKALQHGVCSSQGLQSFNPKHPSTGDPPSSPGPFPPV